jgi:hypothetical protein
VTYGGPLVDVGNPPNPGISKYLTHRHPGRIVILVIALGSGCHVGADRHGDRVGDQPLMLVKILTANFTIGSVPPSSAR